MPPPPIPDFVEVDFCAFGPEPRSSSFDRDDGTIRERIRSSLYLAGARSVMFRHDYLIKAVCPRPCAMDVRDALTRMCFGGDGISVQTYLRGFHHFGTFNSSDPIVLLADLYG